MSNLCRVVPIIGAPRSGTNLLRDLITASGFATTWPCDEINYIWRHGHIAYPSDEFSSDMVSPEISEFVWKQCKKISHRAGISTVIEKTCANSLRVQFVDTVLKQPVHIFIHRNGYDATASAIKRWTAAIEWRYSMQKARYVPVMDLPHYALAFVRNRLRMLMSSDGRMKTWGPRFEGMTDLVDQLSLPELCALQWSRCVNAALDAYREVPDHRVVVVSYETLVSNPVSELKRITQFIDLPWSESLEHATHRVSSSSVGRGLDEIPSEVAPRVKALVEPTLKRLGYAT